MKYNITHIILPMIVAAMACATSCASDPEPDALESGEVMQFEAMEAPASRTIITKDANITKKPFMVFGEVNRTGVFYQGIQRIFTGDKVTYNSTTKNWTYDTSIYWLMGQEHSFVAVHPAYIQEIPEKIEYKDSRISFTYETPLDEDCYYKESTDILIAAHRRIYNLDRAGAVKFRFKHILTRLDIAPALEEALMYPDETDKSKYPDNADEYIQIHRIEIYGLRTKASFSFASDHLVPGAVQTDDWSETYDLDLNSVKPIKLEFRDDTIKVTNNNQNVSVFDDDNALLLLPQKIGDGVYVIVYYTVNGDHTVNDLIRKITFPLSGISEWEVGKKYTYKFSFQKAYTDQIKPGSLTWEVDDMSIPEDEDKTNWIDGDDVIRQEFDISDDDDN